MKSMSSTCGAVMLGLLFSGVAAVRIETPIRFTDVLFDIKSKLGQATDVLFDIQEKPGQATDVLFDIQEKPGQARPQAGNAVPSGSPWAKSVAQKFKIADGALERVLKAHTAAEMSKLESLNAQMKRGETEPQFNEEELKTAREKVRIGIETAFAQVDDVLKVLERVREERPDIMKKEVQALIHITGAAKKGFAELVTELDGDKKELAELVTELDGDEDPAVSAAASSTKNIDVDAASQTVEGALDLVKRARVLAEKLYFDDHVQNARAVKTLLRRPEKLLSSVNMKFLEVLLEKNKLLASTLEKMSDEERKNFKANNDKERNDAIDAAQKLAKQALTALDNCKLEAEKFGNTAITGWVGKTQADVKQRLTDEANVKRLVTEAQDVVEKLLKEF